MKKFLALLLSAVLLLSVIPPFAVAVEYADTYETALNLAAQGVVLCHNHPDGLCEPSPEDIEVTAQLGALLEMLDIRLLDHVIVAGDAACSMAELGLLK